MFEELGGEVGAGSNLGAFQSGKMGGLYGRFADLRIHEGLEQEALAVADRGRAQGLARQIAINAENVGSILSQGDADLLHDTRQAYEEAMTRLRSLNESLERSAFPAQKAALLVQVDGAKALVSDAERKYELTRDAVFGRYPGLERISGKEKETRANQDLAQIANKAPETMFIELALTGDDLLTFTMSRQSGIKAFRMELKTAQLQADVNAYLYAVRTNAREEARLARKLYTEILGQADKILLNPGIKRVCIVADGPLLDVPFAALMDGNGRRLIQRLAVSSAASLGCLSWPETNRKPSQPLLVVADPTGEGTARIVTPDRGGFAPLPGAKREGEEIAKTIPRTLALYGADATETTVKNELPSYALLHFACHGYLDGANAMHSALVMADNAEGQGYLTTEDIVGMRLSAKLAVLSACHTGEGLQSGGEGLMGLTWAFRAAGVPAVVASKWEVDDQATARIMVAFYHKLLAGARKDDALRLAMLEEMKRQENGSAPRLIGVTGQPAPEKRSPVYYWAAFQLIGDANPLKLPLVEKPLGSDK
jgi:CHAT domain-containing protein